MTATAPALGLRVVVLIGGGLLVVCSDIPVASSRVLRGGGGAKAEVSSDGSDGGNAGSLSSLGMGEVKGFEPNMFRETLPSMKGREKSNESCQKNVAGQRKRIG